MLTTQQASVILRYFIASVWFINGLYCKVLGFVPRHEQIVARILGDDYSTQFTIAIGIAEVLMALWVLSGIKSHLNYRAQILLVASMNILEFILVPDLLLWGKFNAVFALMFILLVYYHGFILNRKLSPRP